MRSKADIGPLIKIQCHERRLALYDGRIVYRGGWNGGRRDSVREGEHRATGAMASDLKLSKQPLARLPHSTGSSWPGSTSRPRQGRATTH
jgi:hypothetical protein